MDRRPALDQSDGRHVGLVGRRHHDLRRRLDPPPEPARLFCPGRRSSIYDDVVYEGQSIEMERLWLWVARNIPGLSRSHREAVMRRFGIGAAELDAAADLGGSALRAPRRRAPCRAALCRVARLAAPAAGRLPRFRRPGSPFSTRSSPIPAPDAFRARHNFRAHDRHPRISRHELVRHFPDERHRGVQGHPGAHRHPEIVDRPERALLCLCRAISGRATPISSGSITG